MTIRILIATTLLLGAAVHAEEDRYAGRVDDPIISQAYETSVADFRPPLSVNGGIALRECDGCEPITIRVDAETRYVVNGKTVSLKDFRKAIFRVRDRSNTPMGVLHHLETDRVTLITVNL